MNLEPYILIALCIVVGWLVFDRLTSKKDTMPELEPEERFAIVKKGQSNLSVVRKGTEVSAVDEEGEEIPLQITRK